MARIYLDNAAATKLRPEVLAAMLPYLTMSYGNPSSIHHEGRVGAHALTSARATIAHALAIDPDEIIFTSGGTEANNLALRGVVQHVKRPTSHILVSAIEHSSILETAEHLRADGVDVEYIPVDTYGRVSVDDVLLRVRPETTLISIMLANNEIGTIEPISKISHALRERFGSSRPLFHTDACQALGQLPVLPREFGVDLMTLNSGKIYGPKGIGMLYVRRGVDLTPQITGGWQEHGRRAGTENVSGIVGFARALTLAVEEQEATMERLTTLRTILISFNRLKGFGGVLNGHETERLPNNAHFSFPNIEGEALILLLDSYGISASTGSACNAHNLLPSHVLCATGQSPELIHGSVRLTLGKDTTEEEILYTIKSLSACIERLRALSPLPLHL